MARLAVALAFVVLLVPPARAGETERVVLRRAADGEAVYEGVYRIADAVGWTFVVLRDLCSGAEAAAPRAIPLALLKQAYLPSRPWPDGPGDSPRPVGDAAYRLPGARSAPPPAAPGVQHPTVSQDAVLAGRAAAARAHAPRADRILPPVSDASLEDARERARIRSAAVEVTTAPASGAQRGERYLLPE